MRITSLLTAILFSLVFFGCNRDLELRNNEKEIVDSGNQPDDSRVVEGIIRIKLSPEIGDNFISANSNTLTKSGNDALDSFMHQIGAKSMTRVFPYNKEYERLVRKEGLHLWYDIEFDTSKPVTKVASNLEAIEGISCVEKLYKIKAPIEHVMYADMPVSSKADEDFPMNDPRLKDQWNYNNDGTLSNSKKGADINLFKAWEITTGTDDVIVAVIDGGIDVTHPDLEANIWINQKEKDGETGKDDDGDSYVDDINGYNFVSGNGSGTITPHTHGTHVAGIIGARNNNKLGICGIAGGDDKVPGTGVKLMSCQIFEHVSNSKDNFANDGNIAKAFHYAVTHGAVIAQNSWGPDYPQDRMLRPDIEGAIKFFTKYAGCDPKTEERRSDSKMKGGIVIFAAGNKNTESIGYPMCYDDVIVVSAMAPNFLKAEYSNRGTRVDITAPGGEDGVRGILSTLPNKNYGYDCGTSMACPHVSGVAALIVSKFGGKDFTNKDLRKQLLSALAPYNINEYNPLYAGTLGRGYLDAEAALKKGSDQNPEAVKNVNIKSSINTIDLSWEAVKDADDGTAFRYFVYYSTKSIDKADLSAYNKVIVDAANKNMGETVNVSIKRLEMNTEYNFAIVSEDRWSLQSEPYMFKASTNNNNAPELKVEGAENLRLATNATGTVRITVTDPENHKWEYSIEGDNADVQDKIVDENIIELSITARGSIGSHEFTVKVTDDYGAESSAKISYEIYKNNAPKLEKPISNLVFIAKSTADIDLSEYFTDPDNNQIIYSAKTNDANIATPSVKDNILTITANSKGTCNITINAKDEHGAMADANFTVTVSEDELVIKASPNPVNDVLNVIISKRVNNCNLVIAGATGKVVLNKDLSFGSDAERNLNINVAKLAAGAYVLKVSSNGETFTQHFVKL